MGEEGNLVWTDDKVELLLDTVRDFKAEKEQQATNWELLNVKYERFKEGFIRNFSDGKKNEEYPHSVTVFTRERIASKIKRLRSGYRKELDTKRKSGGRNHFFMTNGLKYEVDFLLQNQ